MRLSEQVFWLLIALFMSGCAWNYAGQEGKVEREPVEKPDVRVVELEKKETPRVVDVKPEPENTSPCGVDVFTTYYFDASTQVERTVDCRTRAVTSIERKPLGETLYTDRKTNGYPEGVWYIAVDPRGIKPGYLNNAHLLKLSQNFKIEFFGRAQDGLLVYIFHDEVAENVQSATLRTVQNH